MLDLVGKTPAIRIRKMSPNPGVEIIAKLEGWNPSGSVKDRAALHMVEAAERQGLLGNGKKILEATSGNTGIALAMIGAARGYEIVIAVPESASLERRQMMAAFGARLILTPAAEGTDGAIRLVRRMAKQKPEKYFVPDQFANSANPLAHYERTAEELLQQAGGRLDAFVAAIGSGGTLMGVSRLLREKSPSTRIIGVEPVRGHRLQGMKNLEESEVPAIYDGRMLDGKVRVNDSDALGAMRRLAREEGILAGMSSGAAMAAAMGHARTMESGRIAVLFPDRGERYFSTGAFG